MAAEARTSTNSPVEASVDSPGILGTSPDERQDVTLELPRLSPTQTLDLGKLRKGWATFYHAFVLMPGILLALAVVALVAAIVSGGSFISFAEVLVIVGIPGGLYLFQFVEYKLFFAMVRGNTIEVGPTQYPYIHQLIAHASRILGIRPPTLFILQGHGLVEMFVSKLLSRRGVLIITSNLLDEVSKTGSSRELMFVVGRQLGLIRIGFFRLWFLRHTLGQFTFLFYWAWNRRAHLLADKVGLLVAGDLFAAEQALLLLTVGAALAPATRMEPIQEQQQHMFESPWTWIRLGFSTYPFLVDRIPRLREFAAEAAREGIAASATKAIGVLPLEHRPIRSFVVMIIHGHDRTARTELESFLLKKFPHVNPVLMVAETEGAAAIPEKLERVAARARGAIALLTPDDFAVTAATGQAAARARQNVALEIGWFWARLGRSRCLLLKRGDVEIPSDLAGADIYPFRESPNECSEVVRNFMERLETSAET